MIATLSNVEMFSCVTSRLVTTISTSRVELFVAVVDPTLYHVDLSGELYPEITLPLRTSLSQ